MKSKLFLSLSLLTAVFSMNALSPSVHETFRAYNLRAGSAMANGIEAVAANPKVYGQLAGMLALPVAGTVVGCALNSYMQPKQEVQSTRFERVKTSLNNGYATVKANAVNGYNSSMSFVKANPKSTAGAVAAVAGLGLVAYKYSDSIFGKSKAVKAPVAPVAPKAPVRVAVAKRNLTR